MRNIAFFIMDMSNGGGTERVTSVIANQLVKQHNVFIISALNGMDPVFNIASDIKLLSLGRGGLQAKNLRQNYHISHAIKKCVRNNKIDILIVVDTILMNYCIPIILHKKKLGLKIIAWEQFNYYVQGRQRIFARKLATKYADTVLTLVKGDKQNWKDNFKHINRMEYIYNPVTLPENIHSDLSHKTVIAVGRLEPQKGFDLLLKSWSIVEKSTTDWKLQIIGDGSQRDELNKYIVNNKLKNVELISFQKNISQYYLNASIFAFSSRFEGFGLVLVEAQNYGLPVVSYACKEGPSEIVTDNINGFLVEPENTELFAEKLIELINDDKLRVAFAENSGKDLVRFKVVNIILKWNELLESL